MNELRERGVTSKKGEQSSELSFIIASHRIEGMAISRNPLTKEIQENYGSLNCMSRSRKTNATGRQESSVMHRLGCVLRDDTLDMSTIIDSV